MVVAPVGSSGSEPGCELAWCAFGSAFEPVGGLEPVESGVGSGLSVIFGCELV